MEISYANQRKITLRDGVVRPVEVNALEDQQGVAESHSQEVPWGYNFGLNCDISGLNCDRFGLPRVTISG
jgi:hypothetical protein